MRRTYFSAAILAVCALGAGRAQAAPVGMACQIKGKPEVKSGAAWKPLRLLQRLEPGDAVRCGAGEGVTVVLFGNGQRFQVAAGDQATVGAASVTGAKALAAAGGPSANAARALGGARVGAVMARPAASHQRLTPDFPGYSLIGADGLLHVAWGPTAGAASYSFTLLDRYDDVVWHEKVADKTEVVIGAGKPSQILKTEMAAARLTWEKDGVTATSLLVGRPYVWQLVAMGRSGKIIGAPRWGVVTFVGRDDADALTAAAAPLLDEAKANPTDPTPHALLAELYRSYGVYDRTLEELEALAAMNAEGAGEAQREAYRQISPYAFGRWLLLEDDKRAAPDEPAAD